MSFVSPSLHRLAEPSSIEGLPLSSPQDDVPRAVRGEVVVEMAMRHAGTRAVTLRYELQGPVDAPVVFVAGGISAHRHLTASNVFPESGWLNDLVGAGRALDPSQCQLLAFDFIGADGRLDAPIDSADQADAIA